VAGKVREGKAGNGQRAKERERDITPPILPIPELVIACDQ